MGVWLWGIGISIVCFGFCFPYIRCLFKRINLLSKIKSICQIKGYHLQGLHRFWFLGGKNGKNCDCVIETEEELFAIKLFGMPRRRRILVFTEKREYFTRILVGILLLIRETFESKTKQLPEYAFSIPGNVASKEKKLRKILLVNPVPMEMLMQAERGKEKKLSPFPVEDMRIENAKERVLSPGDELYGMEVANLSWLLKELTR